MTPADPDRLDDARCTPGVVQRGEGRIIERPVLAPESARSVWQTGSLRANCSHPGRGLETRETALAPTKVEIEWYAEEEAGYNAWLLAEEG